MKKRKINYKIITAFILGIVLASGVAYAATVLGASSVSYNNSSSKLSSTTVQGAIDEIYNNATGGDIAYNNKNIVGAYMYDDVSCKTGEENTCKKTACPNNTSKNTCLPGTIIKYRVNNSTTKTFNVLHDDGTTITMQDNTSTVSSVAWYKDANDNTKGPLTAIETVENATNGWSNVNTISYTMGTTNFNGTNEYTGCSLNAPNWSCMANTYTWPERSAKARMVTAQELISLGCRYASNSCPTWLSTTTYWTMSTHSPYPNSTLVISNSENYLLSNTVMNPTGVRAVVVISK